MGGIVDNWYYAIVDLSNDQTVIHTGRAYLGNIWVRTALSAHDCPIQDDTEAIVTVPSGSAANTAITYAKDTLFRTSLVVDPNDAATGEIIVQWRPAP